MAFPVTSPGPLLPLDAPLPPKRLYTLLDAANVINPGEDRWLAGAWINGYPSARPMTHDPCASGTYRLKAADAGVARPMAGSFTVVIGGSCTARTIGPSADWYTERLRLAFEVVESEAVERVLATGAEISASVGAYIGDAEMEVLGAGAQTPIEGLALLEDEIASVGNGVIHVAPLTATYWVSEHLIEPGRDNQMRTRLGTLVVVGAGYRDAQPDGEAAPGADEEWAFATGPIDVRRAPQVTILPGQYSQALDRESNEITFYAERDYLLSWVGRTDSGDTEHIQAGVLIDRVS